MFILALLGCTDVERATGAIDGSDAVVGLAVLGEAVTAYVCGGDSTLQLWTRWWEGSVEADGFEMEVDGWTLSGTLREEGWEGALVSTERAWTWTAPTASDPLIGLYEGDDGSCRTGLVVYADGSDLETQGAWCDDDGVLHQVTPVNLTLEEDGVEVEVELSEGAHTFYVVPVEP